MGEQAMATFKGWRLLRKLRCSTNRITDIVKTVLTIAMSQPEVGKSSMRPVTDYEDFSHFEKAAQRDRWPVPLELSGPAPPD